MGGVSLVTWIDLVALVLPHIVSVAWPLPPSLCASVSSPQRDSEQKRSSVRAFGLLCPPYLGGLSKGLPTIELRLPKKRFLEVLIPNTSEFDLVWK